MIPSSGTILQYWQSQRPRTLQVAPGPSDVGGCERRFKYKTLGYPQTNVASSTQSAIGTATHEKIAEAAKEINEVKQLGWLVEHEVSFGGLTGTMDLYAEETVVDHKTVGARAFEEVGIHGPYRSHNWQVHWYGGGALNQGLPVKYVQINYIDRDSGRERIWTGAFDLRVLRDAAEWKQRIISTPLEACPRTYAPDSIFCRNCPFFDHCWQGGVPDRDPRSVEYVSGDLDAYLDELYETRQAIKELRDTEKRLKGVLDAVRPDDMSTIVEGTNRAIRWKVRYLADGTESYGLWFTPKSEPS